MSSYTPPRVGARTGPDEYNARTLEWDGEAWAPVCSRDDIAMTGRDAQRHLICTACGIRATDDHPNSGRRTA